MSRLGDDPADFSVDVPELCKRIAQTVKDPIERGALAWEVHMYLEDRHFGFGDAPEAIYSWPFIYDEIERHLEGT